jgi:hypothetical protein
MSELLRHQLEGSLAVEAIKALVKAQGGMSAAHKGKVNPAFRTKYAELSDVMDACMPALRDNGFAVLQPIGRDEHGDYVETFLAHESGYSFTSRTYLIIGKNDMQGFKSAVTYARRIGLGALAGVTDTDDDGNDAAKSKRTPPQRPAEPPHDPETGEVLQRNNPAQAASDGLRDAWIDGIRDAMPFDWPADNDMSKLHPAQQLQYWSALADALIFAFKAKKTAKAVSAQWDYRDALIMEMREAAPIHYERTWEAFSSRMAEFAPGVPMPPMAEEHIRSGSFNG